MTLSLSAQQNGFFSHVVNPPPESLAALQLLKPTRASAVQQFAVYQRAYLARLVDCLRDDYPLVELALGAALFEASCRSYAEAIPPTSNSLNFYGRDFAGFLKARLQAELTWVHDLARVEWALIEAIHADASQVLTSDAFSRFGPELWARLRLQTSESLCLLELDHDIAHCLSELASHESFVAPAQRQSFLAICRRGNDLWRLPLEPWAATLLQQLTNGIGLGEALERLSEDPQFTATEEMVFNMFARWLEAGVFCNAAPY